MEKSLIGRLAFWQKKTDPTSLGIYVYADKLWVYAPAQSDRTELWLPFELKDEHWS